MLPRLRQYEPRTATSRASRIRQDRSGRQHGGCTRRRERPGEARYSTPCTWRSFPYRARWVSLDRSPGDLQVGELGDRVGLGPQPDPAGRERLVLVIEEPRAV